MPRGSPAKSRNRSRRCSQKSRPIERLLYGFYGTESYQNTRGTRLSFETKDDDVSAAGEWRIIDDDVPADRCKLQSFTDGRSVLASPIGQQGSHVIALRPLASQRDEEHELAGLGFSAWYQSTLPRLKLVDKSNGESFVLSPGDGGQLEGDTPSRQWGSWVAKPDETWLQHLAEPIGQRGLLLMVESADSDQVYLDRIELVSEVNGIVLSMAAFSKFFDSFASFFIPIAALLFAFTTVIAGNYYEEVACHFLNKKLVKSYLWIYIICIFLGCSANLDLVINFADLFHGLLTIPNIVVLIVLLPGVVRDTGSYLRALQSGEFSKESSKSSE